MLVRYFGFQEDPFGSTPDPRCLYPSHTHREALASLEYGFRSNRGFTAMIAPPGMGKTTLLFRFLEGIRDSARTVFLFDIDSECEPRDFVGYILRDIGITPGKSSAEMHTQLSDALIAETRAGRKFVVVIDEAQSLSNLVLERVRLLSNFETSSGKLMQIVLSGQLQLADKLLQPTLLQLRQRISTICRLDPLSAEETSAYVDYRLKQAGYDGKPLFTDGALKLITEASQGIPRTINNLCFNALSLCCALNSKQVDDSMVSEVIADLQLSPQSRESIAVADEPDAEQSRNQLLGKNVTPSLGRWVPAIAVLMFLCLLSLLLLTGVWFPQTHKAAENHMLNPKDSSETAPAPSSENSNPTNSEKFSMKAEPFQITIEPNQRLQDIAVYYLGGFDPERLRAIQALNPHLSDPNFIVAGQTIWLPGPPLLAPKRATPPANLRKLP